MNVLYYTAPSFMDISAEIILNLKQKVTLHVLIEITPGSKNRTIIDVDKLPNGKVLYKPEEVLDKISYENLKPYFEGCKSVYFVVHNQKSVLSTLKASYQVLKYINGIKADVLQMEAITIRSLGIVPAMLRIKRILLTIHDPIAHKGESDWRIKFINSAFFKFPAKKSFLFYSKFAKRQFEMAYPKYHLNPSFALRMQPYTYFRNYIKYDASEREHILFIGRLSPYKGVDILLESMTAVFAEYPQEKLIIAGRSINGFEPNQTVINQHNGKINILNRYIPNKELVELVMKAKFVVCPYIEATQSGVVMTAFALNTPVIATDTGAFAEYIQDRKSGRLVKGNNVASLSKGIMSMLKEDQYLEMIKNLTELNKINAWDDNKLVLQDIYFA